MPRKKKTKTKTAKPPRWMGTNEPAPETDMGQEDPLTETLGLLNHEKEVNSFMRRRLSIQTELLERAQKAILILLEPIR